MEYAKAQHSRRYSSLLFSLFINSIGKQLTCDYLLYADDLVIYTHGKNCEEIVKVLLHNLQIILKWCKDNHVEINFDKTEYMIFHKEHDHSIKSEDLQTIQVNGNTIKRVNTFKYLGVLLDPSLNYNMHYESILTKVSNKIKFIHGIKRLISPNVLTTLISAYIHSLSDFAIEVWAVVSTSKLIQLQKKIDSLLLSYFLPSIAKKCRKSRSLVDPNIIYKLYEKCNFLNVQERSIYVNLKLAYKLFSKDQSLLSVNSRHSRTFPLATVPYHLSQSFKRSFKYRHIHLWNQLPKEWPWIGLSYVNFKELVFKWIVGNRNNDYEYY